MNDWFRHLDGTAGGAIIAFFVGITVSMLKVIRDERRITLPDIAEGLICGFFSSGLVGVMVYLLDVNLMLSAFIGCTVASIGSKIISSEIFSVLKKKAGG